MPPRSRRPPPIKRTSGDSFTRADRLLLAERAGWLCELCTRPLQNADPKASDYLIAGHIVAHQDGGKPVLGNGRAECKGCSESIGATQGNIKAKRDYIELREQLRQAHARVAQLESQGTQEISVPDSLGDPPRQERPPLSGPIPQGSGLVTVGDRPASPEPLQRKGFRQSDPADFKGCEWVEPLLVVPESACWPRFMTGPHPDAVGSYGAQLVSFVHDRTGQELDWWQRLISARILEHDAAGELVWQEWILTVARQLGKSYWWRELCLWRMSMAETIGEPQEILHIANKLKVANKIQRPARAWAETQDGWDARHGNGSQEVRRGLSVWSLSTAEGAYGYTISMAGVDEAWAIQPEHIDDGVVPTMLESKWSQLGIISTAHHLATPLVIDRRAAAMDGDGTLLIEWSAGPWLPLEDRAGWRQASPRWTAKREALIARELARALGNQTLSTDPVAFFRSQYLNQWPSKAAHSLTKPGLPLLPEGIWQELAGDAETPGAVVFGLEDIFGRGVAVAAASKALDGRIVVQGFELGDRTVAFEWIGMHSRSHPGSSLVVGPALQADPHIEDLGIPITVSSYAETKACLSQLRQLVSRRLVMHANSPVLAEQMISCRVSETSGIRVISTEPWELVRAASWAAVHLERERRALNIW